MRFPAAIVCVALLAGCGVEADFSGSLQTQTLVAERYEQEIKTIDRFVFEEKPLGEDGARNLENVLHGLSGRVCTRCDSKFLKVESLELQLLAKRAGRLAPNGTGASLQNDWMRIRNNLFDDRAWFARSARDLDYASSEQPEPKRIVARAAAPPQRTLTGRWRAVSILANGQPRTDAELSGSIWTFDPPRLIVRDLAGHETTYNFNEEDGYLSVMTVSGKEGWMKFDLGEEGLRIAFFDGLGGKPEAFEPPPDWRDPMLVAVRLVAER
ncbi:MAG TPA: hypothetical protein VLV78_09825 [Thermoanaerobaculia bacterium]|nr:hypothetical protein [Thermoanaerobaculia bacterium]